jgi:uncharacterized protein with von Willebrand factor type A (vWA) domain
VAEPLGTLTGFGRALRAEGLSVGTGRIAQFCRAAALVGVEDLYWAGRATLVSRPEDTPVYDRVFRTFFGRPEPPRAKHAPMRVRVEVEDEVGLASTAELLRRKSFARCTPEELAQLAKLMARIDLAVPRRRTRRREPDRTGLPDLRRTLRRSFRTGGEPVERAYRARRTRRRRLVLLLDVSGSMAEHSRALLVFAHAALRADRRWEAFCFGTRLTRVTRALATRDLDEALRRASDQVVDWDGGTRIGESLADFLDRFGHGGLARGAVVVICSDGLDVGDPDLLAEQMARLSRLAHRVVWLNPLKEDPAYEPLARGMKAALPYVDVFASGHDLASLEEVAATLERA